MLMDGSHVEMGVVFLNHVGFVPLPKFCFPSISIFGFPLSPRLPHFPIGADYLMSLALAVVTPKLVLKTEWYLFQFCPRGFQPCGFFT